MFNLTSKIEKFCDVVLIPNATRLDAAVAYGVPVVQNKLANSLDKMSKAVASKAQDVAKKSEVDAAQGKQVFDALFPGKQSAAETKAVVDINQNVVSDAAFAMWVKLSPVEKLEFAAHSPEFFARMTARESK